MRCFHLLSTQKYVIYGELCSIFDILVEKLVFTPEILLCMIPLLPSCLPIHRGLRVNPCFVNLSWEVACFFMRAALPDRNFHSVRASARSRRARVAVKNCLDLSLSWRRDFAFSVL